MKRLDCHGDSRILQGCFHCGEAPDTDDHTPPRVLLDKPYPEEMITVPSCYACNNSASRDEAYLACVIEFAVTGEVTAEGVSRTAIKKMLAHSPALAAQMDATREITETGPIFSPDMGRVRKALIKIARAHAGYELHDHFEEEPTTAEVFPLPLLEVEQRNLFEQPAGGAMWPEVGSRAMQRLLEGYPGNRPGWVVVQEGRYRYMAAIGEGRVVRIVLSEYLGFEAVWDF